MGKAKPTLESRIVAAILADFTDRRGLRQGWDGIDDEIRAEIVREWKRLVKRELPEAEKVR